ncbi:MAG: glycoside hydrolase family 27 protein [Thermoleophilaceae bacterium]
MGRLGIIALAVVLLALAVGASPSRALENGLARTPPMGWNAFYSLGCHVDERVVRETADALRATGMADAGYRYVILYDCWMAHGRGADGSLRAQRDRFPHGIVALADYVHERGLKLGVYLDAGTHTCAYYAGSGGHLTQDVRTVAGWGVDYLKVDWCFTGGQSARRTYAHISRTLKATGRAIVFSVSDWGHYTPWAWGRGVANLWRVSGDLDWDSPPAHPWQAMLTAVGIDAGLARYAGPGAWNDLDLLPVGAARLTTREMRSAFSLWSILASPLVAGNDLRTMSDAARDILTNAEVIAIDQDPAGLQGTRVAASRGREVWVRRLAGRQRAVLFFNRSGHEAAFRLDVRRLGLHARRYHVRDLWVHRTHTIVRWIRARVPSHGVALLRVTSGH